MNRKEELTAVARSMASFSIAAMLGMMVSSVGADDGGGELEMGFAAGGAPPPAMFFFLFLFLLLFFLLAMFVCFFHSK
jgi:hypothetical protein